MQEPHQRPGLGDFIRLARARKHLSQRELSALSGLSAAYVSKVEASSIEPSFKAFSKIATVLGLNAHEVLVLTRISAGECRTSVGGSTLVEESA